MIRLDRRAIIGMVITGLVYFLATGAFTGCVIATLIMILFVSYVPKGMP